MPDTFEDSRINWKIDRWKSPSIRHRERERWIFMKTTQINLMGEDGLTYFESNFGSAFQEVTAKNFSDWRETGWGNISSPKQNKGRKHPHKHGRTISWNTRRITWNARRKTLQASTEGGRFLIKERPFDWHRVFISNKGVFFKVLRPRNHQIRNEKSLDTEKWSLPDSHWVAFLVIEGNQPWGNWIQNEGIGC